jgi:DNA-binding transcriptional regulator YhcF (GntR family)
MRMGGTGGPGAPLRIQRGSEVPPRRQIALRLEAGIRDGGYADGAKLPSVRAMGQRLGVHRDTVAAAYRELGRQGLVTAVPGSGVYVSPREPVLTRTLGRDDGALAMRLASLSAAIRLRRILLLCEHPVLGEVIGRELATSISGLKLRCESPPARPCPGLHFGWLPIQVLTSEPVLSDPGIEASDRRDSPALSPIPLRAGLSEFDLKILSTQRFPAVVGVLSNSDIVKRTVREAVRGGAGPDVGIVSASPGDCVAKRRHRARATIVGLDAVSATGIPRLSGRRHLLLRLVPVRFVSELLDLLGDRYVVNRRQSESTDRVRAGLAGRA